MQIFRNSDWLKVGYESQTVQFCVITFWRGKQETASLLQSNDDVTRDDF